MGNVLCAYWTHYTVLHVPRKMCKNNYYCQNFVKFPTQHTVFQRCEQVGYSMDPAWSIGSKDLGFVCF